MSTAAENIVSSMLEVDETLLPMYLRTRRCGGVLMNTIRTVDMDSSGRMGFDEAHFWLQTQREFYGGLENYPAIGRAVVASMVAEQIGYPHRLGWKETPKALERVLPENMRGFLGEAIDMFRELKPKTSGKFVSVDLEAAAKWREHEFGKTTTEFLAVLGLNGSGKTTLVKALSDFGRSLGFEVSTVKFPRYDGVLGRTISAQLDAGTQESDRLERGALQLVFLADFFDYLSSLDSHAPVCVADRFATLDGQVYSTEFGRLMSLCATEGVAVPVTAMVIERHPLSCLGARLAGRRVFERDVRQMAEQMVEFYRLLSFSGVHLVNTDQQPDADDPVFLAAYRMLLFSVRSGIWHRALLKTGASDWLEADGKIDDKLHEWFMERVKE